MDCQRIESNEQGCTCKKVTCKNHGKCCLCVTSHRERGNYPACLRYED